MPILKYTKEGNLTVSYPIDSYTVNAKRFLEALKAIQKRRMCSTSGICNNIARLGYEGMDSNHTVGEIVSALAESWEKHSGSYMYPIPPTGNATDGREAYENYKCHWDRSTKYGSMRHELLEFLINKVETFINTDLVKQDLMVEAEKLITKVKRAGYVMTIDLHTLEPLAMGNTTMVPSIRKSRGNY